MYAVNFMLLFIYLFFYFVLPGITRPGWSASLPAAPLNSECRGRGGVPRLAVPPAHVYKSNLKHQFFEVRMGTKFS